MTQYELIEFVGGPMDGEAHTYTQGLCPASALNYRIRHELAYGCGNDD